MRKKVLSFRQKSYLFFVISSLIFFLLVLFSKIIVYFAKNYLDTCHQVIFAGCLSCASNSRPSARPGHFTRAVPPSFVLLLAIKPAEWRDCRLPCRKKHCYYGQVLSTLPSLRANLQGYIQGCLSQDLWQKTEIVMGTHVTHASIQGVFWSASILVLIKYSKKRHAKSQWSHILITMNNF